MEVVVESPRRTQPASKETDWWKAFWYFIDLYRDQTLANRLAAVAVRSWNERA